MDKNIFINSFQNPSREYGEVPFYWWNGDRLDESRITSQLEALAEKGVAGVQVNYCHLVKGGEFDEQYGGHGKSRPGEPYQFSEEWWKFFCHAACECERLGMGIGVGDYTIAWIGNGFFTDKVSAVPGMTATELECERKMLFMGENGFDEGVFAVIYYKTRGYEEPVLLYERGRGMLAPMPACAECFIIRDKKIPFSVDPLNPECGTELVKIYF